MANSNLVQLIKQIAVEAVNAAKPCDYRTGTVVSVNPLKIKMSNTITLDNDFLDITETAYNSLTTGDKVLLFRKSGGKRYVVIDRVVTA